MRDQMAAARNQGVIFKICSHLRQFRSAGEISLIFTRISDSETLSPESQNVMDFVRAFRSAWLRKCIHFPETTHTATMSLHFSGQLSSRRHFPKDGIAYDNELPPHQYSFDSNHRNTNEQPTFRKDGKGLRRKRRHQKY
jgi:hypothetical protein